jgi:hypothetical protein
MHMNDTPSSQELLHEIFGSILDRTEMTPFLLLPATDYASSQWQDAFIGLLAFIIFRPYGHFGKKIRKAKI